MYWTIHIANCKYDIKGWYNRAEKTQWPTLIPSVNLCDETSKNVRIPQQGRRTKELFLFLSKHYVHKRSACIKSWYDETVKTCCSENSGVSENHCKKRTGQNKTVQWNNDNWFIFMIEAEKPIAHSSPEAGLHRSQSTAAAPPFDIHTHLQSRFRTVNFSTAVLHGGRWIWFFPPTTSFAAAPTLPDAAHASRTRASVNQLLRSGWSETKHSTHTQHYEPDQQCFAHFFLLTRHISLSICLLCFFLPPIGRWCHNLPGNKRWWLFCAYII